jgi:hypothetical protein
MYLRNVTYAQLTLHAVEDFTASLVRRHDASMPSTRADRVIVHRSTLTLGDALPDRIYARGEVKVASGCAR